MSIDADDIDLILHIVDGISDHIQDRISRLAQIVFIRIKENIILEPDIDYAVTALHHFNGAGISAVLHILFQILIELIEILRQFF